MLLKTHLAIGLFSMLLFLDKVSNKFVFVPVVLIASILPDIGNGLRFSRGKVAFRPLKILRNFNGIFKSFTFCVFIGFLLAYYLPIAAFPFFLGYALHLLVDSWSLEGIRPFWPLKYELKGKVNVGGIVEESVFLVFFILNIAALILVVT